MLEVPVPDQSRARQTAPPEQRAVLEDRLSRAGLDVYAYRANATYDVVGDDDPVF